jgi:hypothetical protein
VARYQNSHGLVRGAWRAASLQGQPWHWWSAQSKLQVNRGISATMLLAAIAASTQPLCGCGRGINASADYQNNHGSGGAVTTRAALGSEAAIGISVGALAPAAGAVIA